MQYTVLKFSAICGIISVKKQMMNRRKAYAVIPRQYRIGR